jgi:pilus assembly protein Flp/PilA
LAELAASGREFGIGTIIVLVLLINGSLTGR